MKQPHDLFYSMFFACLVFNQNIVLVNRIKAIIIIGCTNRRTVQNKVKKIIAIIISLLIFGFRLDICMVRFTYIRNFWHIGFYFIKNIFYRVVYILKCAVLLVNRYFYDYCSVIMCVCINRQECRNLTVNWKSVFPGLSSGYFLLSNRRFSLKEKFWLICSIWYLLIFSIVRFFGLTAVHFSLNLHVFNTQIMKKQFTTDWMLISLLICAIIMILIDMASQNRRVQN